MTKETRNTSTAIQKDTASHTTATLLLTSEAVATAADTEAEDDTVVDVGKRSGRREAAAIVLTFEGPLEYDGPMPAQENKVELVGHYGSDEIHALSAWTSTSRDLTDEKVDRIPALLKMLAENGHETPFEKSSIHFLVTCDIASHIHILKHRIGVSVNGESARYKELKDDKFYVPVDWDVEEKDRYTFHLEHSLRLYHDTLERLVSKGMTRKRAKETARFYLPYGNQITADVMFNFRSFVHFLHLRYSKHAQTEIRDVAYEMLRQVADLGVFDATLNAFDLTDSEGNLRGPFE
jgi:flavin-dependent thymidylate synthase